ncbi:MAG TPA: LysR family transcriptional regulator [Geminicoccaceae bacterium]|nr:LysR family transcriptional regulator [Geminicoccaceae bacterium]
MELRQIHYFLAVVKHRNLGRAAQELNIAQPALSKSIRRLEQQLQVKLIERHPRGVEPTAFGKALAAHAELIAVEVGHAMNTICALRQSRRGHVTVGAAPGSSTDLLPRATSALLRKNPDLRITVIGGLSDTLLDSLSQGALDFMISGLSGVAPAANLMHERLFTDRVTVVARAGHPLAGQARLDPDHLVGQKWVLPNPNVLTRQQLEAFFRTQNLAPPDVVIETNSVSHIMAVLRYSDLLSFMPQPLIEFSGGAGDLVPLDLPEAVWHRPVGLSYRRRGFMSPASKALIEELRRTAREIYGA